MIVRRDRVSTGQQQALALDPDVPVDRDFGAKVGDYPRLAGRVDAAHDIAVHVGGGAAVSPAAGRDVAGMAANTMTSAIAAVFRNMIPPFRCGIVYMCECIYHNARHPSQTRQICGAAHINGRLSPPS